MSADQDAKPMASGSSDGSKQEEPINDHSTVTAEPSSTMEVKAENIANGQSPTTKKSGKVWKIVLFSCLGLFVVFIITIILILVFAFRGAKKQYDEAEKAYQDAGGEGQLFEYYDDTEWDGSWDEDWDSWEDDWDDF